MPTALCPLCNARRAKRACPALGRDICAVCCGTKRLVEISCPPSCAYLSSAKAHPAAVIQRRQERDVGFLLPFLTDLTEVQYQLLLVFQAVTVKHAAAALPPLRDEDVADAAAAIAATLETARSGIIYQHHPSSVPGQRLATDLQQALDELARPSGGSRPPRLERDAAMVLRRLEDMARKAPAALPGDEPPVLLKLLGRVLKPSAEPAGAEAAAPRLIIPG